MNTEEKARAYDEALENAKRLYEQGTITESLAYIFPELKNKDERIREEIKVILANTDFSQFALDYTFADMINWLEKQGKSSDQIHYWTEEEIEPIINDYLRGVEHYGGMIGRLRCLKPKSLEKQGNCSVKWQKNTLYNKPAINHSILMKTIQGIAEGEWQGEHWFQYRWSWTLKDSDVSAWMELSNLDEQGEQKPTVVDFNAKDWYVSKVDGKLHNIYQSVDKIEQKPTSDTRYEVKAGDSLSVNGKPFDYEHATITQEDFASVGETATIELSSPIDCGDRIYHVSHKPIEKNGEQKPSNVDYYHVDDEVGNPNDWVITTSYDKVEPKFKVGDWIISKYMHLVMQILNNDNESYKTVETDGTERNDSYDFIERNFKLWTIQDANDGDVLACGDKVTDCPFIFHDLNEELNPRSYCGVNMLQHFQDNDENGGSWCSSTVVRPATKEQCELLFSKMKEEGYQWDADKKELKKIEQKSAWSEEDEEMTDDVIKGCVSAEKAHHFIHTPKEVADWLKSLKNRVQPQIKKWSDEDEENLQHCCMAISVDSLHTYEDKQEMEVWLKSIKNRIGG